MAIDIEFIAPGVATEIVVIVQDQDASIRFRLAIKMGSGETTDSCPHNYQVVDPGIGL